MNMIMRKTLRSLVSHVEMNRNELDSRYAIIYF